jgi:hypothetical protein
MTFSNNTQLALPAVLESIKSLSTSAEDADILLLSSLTAISAILPRYSGLYGGRRHYANLFLFISANASAGKGRIDIARQLVTPVHQSLRAITEAKRAQQQADAELKGCSNPIPVPNRMLFAPANCTPTALYQSLKENDSRLLLYETEADTLSQTLKNDTSNFSDGLRKAFHHEPISYLRRTNNEYSEIAVPQLSVLLAGTPQQIVRLIPDVEDGLFSRFIIYRAPINYEWINVFSPKLMQLSDGIEPISKQLLALHEMFRSARYDVTFSFTPEQCVEFNQFFAQLQSNYLENYGQHIVASIRRIGLISFRFAMILSALRLLERDGGLDCYHITCSDQDFRNALIITQCIIEHTAIIYSELPEPAASLTNKTPYHQALLDQIYKSLPDTFTQADIQRIATEINVSVRSARRYINQLIATNRIDKKAYNSYVKLNNV